MLNVCDDKHSKIVFEGYEKCPLCVALDDDKNTSSRLQQQLDNLQEEFDEYKRKVEEIVENAEKATKAISELKEISG